jgi:hypothetical protein
MNKSWHWGFFSCTIGLEQKTVQFDHFGMDNLETTLKLPVLQTYVCSVTIGETGSVSKGMVRTKSWCVDE